MVAVTIFEEYVSGVKYADISTTNVYMYNIVTKGTKLLIYGPDWLADSI